MAMSLNSCGAGAVDGQPYALVTVGVLVLGKSFVNAKASTPPTDVM